VWLTILFGILPNNSDLVDTVDLVEFNSYYDWQTDRIISDQFIFYNYEYSELTSSYEYRPVGYKATFPRMILNDDEFNKRQKEHKDKWFKLHPRTENWLVYNPPIDWSKLDITKNNVRYFDGSLKRYRTVRCKFVIITETTFDPEYRAKNMFGPALKKLKEK
jgi:hypothetical protein